MRRTPSGSDTVRYFDRTRQTRRVAIACLKKWLVTASLCAIVTGVLYGFSTIRPGVSSSEKYAFNMLVTGLGICLGLSFSDQFAQFCQMMRWRFLAASYRDLEQFDLVLGCHSMANTVKMLTRGGRKGQWYPTKSQVLAAFWIGVFLLFNVAAALLGLTFSTDISENTIETVYGNISVADLTYISGDQQDDPANYPIYRQLEAANIWGLSGQNLVWNRNDSIDNVVGAYDPQISTNGDDGNWAGASFWYRFVDLAPPSDPDDDVSGEAAASTGSNIVTGRTVNATASCLEWEVTGGGHAGYGPDANLTSPLNVNITRNGVNMTFSVQQQIVNAVTWMTYNQSVTCGPRCAVNLALMVSDAYNTEGTPLVPKPRFFVCNNTVSDVAGYNDEGFADPDRLLMPDTQAWIVAGSIGLSGIGSSQDFLQYSVIRGDGPYNPISNGTDADYIAALMMAYSTSILATMDYRGGPRTLIEGPNSPRPATIINVKWPYAGAILAGIPVVQLILLVLVVWYSRKAIILEPSYVTAAHLLYPAIQKIGSKGTLMGISEMAERVGRGYKLMYAVRPDPNDPGHHDPDFVRDLDLLDESEGLGPVRGNMPQGRYD
jgi:hypothetical protein